MICLKDIQSPFKTSEWAGGDSDIRHTPESLAEECRIISEQLVALAPGFETTWPDYVTLTAYLRGACFKAFDMCSAQRHKDSEARHSTKRPQRTVSLDELA